MSVANDPAAVAAAEEDQTGRDAMAHERCASALAAARRYTRAARQPPQTLQ
jgi:hypothetical protein